MLKIVLLLSVFATTVMCHPLEGDDKENVAKLGNVVVSSDHEFPEGGFNQEPRHTCTLYRYFPLSRSKRQSGFGLTGNHVPGVGGSATLNGNWNPINTPQDKLNIHGSHTQVFDHNLRRVGPGSNTAGFDYAHTSRNGKATWGVGTNTDFGRGRRPVHNVGANFRYNF